MNPNQTLQILDRMSRLDPVYQNRNLKAPSDPFLEGFAFGHQLRQNYLAEREAKENQKRQREIQDMYLRAHGGQGGGENPVVGSSIPDSPYPVNNNSMGDNPLGGTGYFANAIRNVEGNTNGDGSFNINDYVSKESGEAPITDYSKVIGSAQQPDNTMNITSQPIGWNYNGRIDGQVGGLGIPQKPQVGFGTALTNAEQSQQASSPISNVSQAVIRNGGKLSEDAWNKMKSAANPQEPSSDNARALEGKILNSATLEDYLNPKSSGVQSSRQNLNYLGDEYEMGRWMRDDEASGVTNPLVRLLRYQTMVEPLRESAREDELRNAFRIIQTADPKSQEYSDAVSLIQYHKNDPYMAENQDMKRDKFMYDQGYIRDKDGENASNNILSVLSNYEEGEQWMSPDGTGTSRTQCSNWVSDVLKKAGIKGIGSPNGDVLMSQFGNAYHEGLDGIKAGDVLNFKDHVGIYVGNGQYVARNSSGGVHQGSMEEAIRAFGQPLGYASVGEYMGRNRKYLRDPNRVTQREEFDYRKSRDAQAFALQKERIDAKYGNKVGKTGNIGFDKKGNLILDYENDMRLGTAMDAFKNEFDNPTGKEGKMSANAMMGVVSSLSPIYQYLIRNGLSENDAKLAMRDLLNDRLGKDYQGKVGYQMMGDIVDRIALGGGQPQSQQQINGIGGYGAKVNEKKKDGSNHVGFLNIFGDGTDSDQFDGNSMDKSQINEMKSQRRWSIYDQAKQNGVISGMDYLGRTVDKYGNIVELDDYGYAKDGLTPEERQYRVARQHREETRGLYQD